MSFIIHWLINNGDYLCDKILQKGVLDKKVYFEKITFNDPTVNDSVIINLVPDSSP